MTEALNTDEHVDIPSLNMGHRVKVERFAEAFWNALHPTPSEQWHDVVRMADEQGIDGGTIHSLIAEYRRGMHVALVMEMEREKLADG